jgi:hypothetical protein
MTERHEPRQRLILAEIEQLLQALREAHGEDETYRSAAKAVRDFQQSLIDIARRDRNRPKR